MSWPPCCGPAPGYPLLGLALLALVGWLAGHDVARRTIRSTGLARFVAGCLLAGYGWLAVAGACWLLGGAAPDGPRYDAVVHAVFLGFTLSMIMAHAPVILPAVLRRPLPYHPAMIAPAALLHGSLALRLWAATPAESTSPGRSAASSTSPRCCCSPAWRPGRRCAPRTGPVRP